MLARDKGALARLVADTLANLVQLEWGKDMPGFNQVFTNLFIPSGIKEQHQWWQRLERETATPDVAMRIFGVLHEIDVRADVANLAVPTLVFHAKDDARIPFEEKRKLASLILWAQFVPPDNANHILPESEPAWDVFRATVHAFLPGPPAPHLDAPAFGLTKAEAAVVTLVAQGLVTADRADALGKSGKIIRNQITVALDKTGARTRSELIVRVMSGA